MTDTRTETDRDVIGQQVSELSTTDGLAAFLANLGYDTSRRQVLPAEALGLAEGEATYRHIEVLSEDAEGFLRVIFVKLRSITAKARNDLVALLGKQAQDHLLILTKDFQVLEFVLIDKVRQKRHGPVAAAAYKPKAVVYSVPRKNPSRTDLRVLRGLTWTTRDGLEQFDKLRHVFQNAQYAGKYYQNRALFADHYLDTRLKDAPAWRQDPSAAYQGVRQIAADARARLKGKDEQEAREALYGPLWKVLGFKATLGKAVGDDGPTPDYVLPARDGTPRTVALVYQWDRWLDGPDQNDRQTPEENPGAAVVSLLERGDAEWVIVTSGNRWRLYSRSAHSRSTNFYEVDLEEVLHASGDTDPNEAFRYWWLFFRAEAFAPLTAEEPAAGTAPQCWLDTVVAGSREYAKQVEDRLKKRVFDHIVPHLAMGFLADRRNRLNIRTAATDDELEEIRQATLTLLYRLLFLLYAESRNLLPVNESPYQAVSLKRIKDEIAEAAGVAEEAVDAQLEKAYRKTEAALYDRLSALFKVMDRGDPLLNVPTYNGGLFITRPADDDTSREAHNARFLIQHKVPDLYLAQAIDHLSRDPDERTFGLVFIDYKSLGVRQLGSIYEGLLEYRLKLADEDLATVRGRDGERIIPLSQAAGRRRNQAQVFVRRGEPYLANDRSERRATGSYYTPDHIVKYIVQETVGPVLQKKLEELVPAFRNAEKFYHRERRNFAAAPGMVPENQSVASLAMERMFAAHRELVERTFDCKVLDPAMGSGHFLVEVVDFVTDKLLDFLNRFPINPVYAALSQTRTSILESLQEQGVAVDPEALTDVHLLKRHVLKRCAYGVDLNPMAVELAKVSLWLDAFTLGAPLSFLDHHLRCGNSLIGSTFADLRQATEGQLFGFDYEPVYRAVNHVLLVARMADATASEVHQSAARYGDARQALSGYKIILDILAARYFGHERALTLLQHGSDLDVSSQTALLQGLKRIDRQTVEGVEKLADSRRFFHWELEFPECFFRVRPGTERQVEEKPAGEAGFDAVVGNPPYVRQEAITENKDWFKAAFDAVYAATCDLYVYFMQREIELLKTNGRMSMIVANKWLRAGYGRKLRSYLLRVAKPESIVDFGHSPIFPDADTFPCIPILSRRPQPQDGEVPEGETFKATQFPREDYLPQMAIAPYVVARRHKVGTALLSETAWSLENPHVQELFSRVIATGTKLGELLNSPPHRGIVTGCNDAFFIDDRTKQQLIASDPRSAQIIAPLLRGRDVDRWACRPSGLHMILAQRGITIEDFPAIKKHLSRFRRQLEPCPPGWSGVGEWAGRAGGDYNWYELQGSPADEFVRMVKSPKIVYQEIQYHSWFALDQSGACPNNKAFVLASSDLRLLGVLNSPLMWAVLTRVLPHMKDEALTPSGFIMENVRISLPEGKAGQKTEQIASQLLQLKADEHEWEMRVCAQVGGYTGLPMDDDRCIQWLTRPAADFVRLVRQNAMSSLSPAAEEELHRFYDAAREEQHRRLSQQLTLEKQIATLVEDAYDLSAEERQLLRETRPVRDPIDVLETRLSGLETA